MLKLTRCEPDFPLTAGPFVYVMVRFICCMEPFDHYTKVLCGGGISYTVQETPEQIMAMPEMLYELYPPMIMHAAKP